MARVVVVEEEPGGRGEAADLERARLCGSVLPHLSFSQTSWLLRPAKPCAHRAKRPHA